MKRVFVTGFMGMALMVLILGYPGIVMAENKAGAFTFSPFFGGYIFDKDLELERAWAFGLGLGYNFTKNWAAEFAMNYIKSESDIDGSRVDAYLYHLDALYHFMPDNNLVPYLVVGVGGSTIDPSEGDAVRDPLLNWGGGLKYFINESIALRGDIRHVMVFGSTEHNLMYSVGVTFLFGAKKKEVVPLDSDGDGVYDDVDQCPDTPAGVKVDSGGCPLDSDGDKVYDYLDKCPGTPKWVTVDSNGCPVDSDGDGVYDYLDQCPSTPSGVKVDSKGCPLDGDGDGVYDYLDKCPGTPSGMKVDSSGCPLDSDKDGVLDHMDQCPGTPEGAIVNKVGCWVIEGIQFDSGKWNIKSEFYSILDQVVTVLQRHPTVNVEIQGHTDNRGSEKYNLMLSEKRADSIMNYFIQKGIDKGRMTVKGYGPSKPIASNDTEEGRAMNRRVELTPKY